MRKQLMILAAVALVSASVNVFAATQATNTNTISPTLKINVTVQDAIQLTLSTSAIAGSCVINAGGGADYNVSFGTVDALGINPATCGSLYAPTTPGVTNSAYYSAYVLTPVFTSQAVTTNTVKAFVSTNFAKANLSVVYSTAAPAGIGSLNAMGVGAGAANTLLTNAVSGTAQTQYVGVEVAPTNGSATYVGADSAIVTYTLTVI